MTSNFIALHAIQCRMNDRMFGLITFSEFSKEAWDVLQIFFEESRGGDPKKEESDGTLKRL